MLIIGSTRSAQAVKTVWHRLRQMISTAAASAYPEMVSLYALNLYASPLITKFIKDVKIK